MVLHCGLSDHPTTALGTCESRAVASLWMTPAQEHNDLSWKGVIVLSSVPTIQESIQDGSRHTPELYAEPRVF
jgi:hypothetical protein